MNPSSYLHPRAIVMSSNSRVSTVGRGDGHLENRTDGSNLTWHRHSARAAFALIREKCSDSEELTLFACRLGF